MKPEELAHYRLRALELAIGSSDRDLPPSTEGILARAAEFAAFITQDSKH